MGCRPARVTSYVFAGSSAVTPSSPWPSGYRFRNAAARTRSPSGGSGRALDVERFLQSSHDEPIKVSNSVGVTKAVSGVSVTEETALAASSFAFNLSRRDAATAARHINAAARVAP